MKKSILLCVLFMSVMFAFSQNEDAVIKKDFEQIIAYTKEMNMDKVTSMTYPPLVKLFPEGGLAAMASSLFEGMGVKTMFENTPVNLKVTPVTTLKNAVLCMGEYDANTILEFKDNNMMEMFLNFSPEGQRLEKLDNNKIRMSGKHYLLAIKDTHTENTWKYLNYDEEFMKSEIAQAVLTEEIINNAAKLKQSFIKE
ncbi:MAG: hypothetical protein Q4G48_00380 [Bacteroidia bacterium]|nr:hypothetical protein [Bacteroidia bacterium]